MSIWHPEYDDEEEIDANSWRDIYLSLLDIAIVLLLFIFVALICFAWGFYHG